MIVFLPKIALAFLVFILAINSQACFVEQVIAAVLSSITHEHAGDESSEQNHASPSHKHDEEGNENTFCCDNVLNLYIVSQTPTQIDFSEQLNWLSPPLTIDSEEQTSYFQYEHNLLVLKKAPTIRDRDKYALTCLLHAPPQS